ncbi:MAG: hypothetical protein KC418_14460 [Anaerolineales bacterium]|nr:hypothetical protein [Anaerolineales bacterium]MCB8952410.1 hypothetical protein [Ardenticatenales bacterium]
MKHWRILVGVFGAMVLLLVALTTTFAQSFAEKINGAGGFALIYTPGQGIGIATNLYSDGTNFGVGTSSPTANLHVLNSASDVRLLLQSSGPPLSGSAQYVADAAAGQPAGLILREGGTSHWNIYNQTQGDLRIFSYQFGNGADVFSIKPAGNVGIGTTNPLSRLAVSGLPNSAPDGSGFGGLLCITNNGNIFRCGATREVEAMQQTMLDMEARIEALEAALLPESE